MDHAADHSEGGRRSRSALVVRPCKMSGASGASLRRRTETAGARWVEIDPATKTWTIPLERAKNGRTHVVPLSDDAMELLALARRLPGGNGEYIFPSPTKPQQHLEPHAMTRAVSRICERHELPPGSPHDFRRSGATVLTGEKYGVRRFIIGKVLGHTAQEGAAVTAVYDRNEYLADKRAALDLWAGHLAGLSGEGGGDDPADGAQDRPSEDRALVGELMFGG
ncbi:site-specific integrase [Phenylobacterium sp.]|uniref:site-specific integrase n=1 Tax=Phenylobacterium sp. TaxID=1871053 RepID=UPI0034583A0F